MPCTASDAIAAVYACATEPARWPEALRCIADSFGDAGALLLYGRRDGSLTTIVSPSLRSMIDLYERVWWRHDIRAERAMARLYAEAGGAALTDRHVVTEEEIRGHPIYTEFLARFGLRWTASVQVSPRAEVQVGLSVLRRADRPPFADGELDALADLGRHAEQALRLGLRLVETEAVNLGLGDALSRLATGVFVVDEARRIVFANERAHQLTSSLFSARDGVLACRTPTLDRRLSSLLRTARGGSAAPPVPLVLDAAEGRSAVYAFPLEGEGQAFAAASSPCTVVLAVDLSPGKPLDPGLVRDVYGLTLGEARVAALVGVGIPPREAAARLCIAEETVRSVLKRVFSKLDVSRQAELTELFTRLKVVHPPAARGSAADGRTAIT